MPLGKSNSDLILTPPKRDMCFEFSERTNCICGAPLAKDCPEVIKSFLPGPVRFAQCTSCRSWIQSPQITIRCLTEWYDSKEYQTDGLGYSDYARGEAARRGEATGRYRRDLERILPQHSLVLEVGCATGSFLAALKEAGHGTKGLDLSKTFCGQARDLYGLDVESLDLLSYDGGGERYDAIVLLGTISNLQDLPSHLLHARTLLKRGGLLYFNFPSASSIVARLYRARHWMFTPSVSSFMSTAGCRSVLDRAGFRISRVKRDHQQPTCAKVLTQAKLARVCPLARLLRLADGTLPCSLPVPGIVTVWAHKP